MWNYSQCYVLIPLALTISNLFKVQHIAKMIVTVILYMHDCCYRMTVPPEYFKWSFNKLLNVSKGMVYINLFIHAINDATWVRINFWFYKLV